MAGPSELMQLDGTLYRSLLHQLKKDHHLCGITVDWAEDIKAAELWKELLDSVRGLLKNDVLGLRNLLYRVDIPESSINDMAVNDDSADLDIKVARAILLREIEKVLRRKDYH